MDWGAKMKCPCEICITRAMCVNKGYTEVIGCSFIRDYLHIYKTGNIDIPKLKIFCGFMNLKLVKRKGHFHGCHNAYYIEE